MKQMGEIKYVNSLPTSLPYSLAILSPPSTHAFPSSNNPSISPFFPTPSIIPPSRPSICHSFILTLHIKLTHNSHPVSVKISIQMSPLSYFMSLRHQIIVTYIRHTVSPTSHSVTNIARCHQHRMVSPNIAWCHQTLHGVPNIAVSPVSPPTCSG